MAFRRFRDLDSKSSEWLCPKKMCTEQRRIVHCEVHAQPLSHCRTVGLHIDRAVHYRTRLLDAYENQTHQRSCSTQKKPQKIKMLVTVCVEHRRVDYITRLARFLKNDAWCDHSQTKKWCLQQRHNLKSCLNIKKGYHDNIRFWHCDQTCIVDMITEKMLYLLTVCR